RDLQSCRFAPHRSSSSLPSVSCMRLKQTLSAKCQWLRAGSASFSAASPEPDVPWVRHAEPAPKLCPTPAAALKLLRTPPHCHQSEFLDFPELCGRSGPPADPIVALFF